MGELKIVGVFAPKATELIPKEYLKDPKFADTVMDRIASGPVSLTVYHSQAGGRFEMNKDIAMPAELWHEPMPPFMPEPWKVAAAKTLRFEDRQGLLVAKLRFGYGSWPNDTYLAHLELHDKDGKLLASDDTSFVNDAKSLDRIGILKTAAGSSVPMVPRWDYWLEESLQFDLGRVTDLTNAACFLLTLSRPGQNAPAPNGAGTQPGG